MWLPNVGDLSHHINENIKYITKCENLDQYNLLNGINEFWLLLRPSVLNQYSILVSELLHHYIVCVQIMDLMLFQHFPGIPITEPKYFSQMSVQELAHVLRSDNETPMPMLQERHQVWTS